MTCTRLSTLPGRAASLSRGGPEGERRAPQEMVRAGKLKLLPLESEPASSCAAVSLEPPTYAIQRPVCCRSLSCVHGLGGDQSWRSGIALHGWIFM